MKKFPEPQSVREAETRIAGLRLTIMDIQTQLQWRADDIRLKKLKTNDHKVPREEWIEYIEWRQRTQYAVQMKLIELGQLREWLRRKKYAAVELDHIVLNVEKPETVLYHAFGLLRVLGLEDRVQYSSEEDDLLAIVRMCLEQMDYGPQG